MLENLTDDGTLKFSFRRSICRSCTLFGKKRIEHRASLQTVVIEPDVPRVILVWQPVLPAITSSMAGRNGVREKGYL